MTTHDLTSHNGGDWRCAVCGAVFPFEMLLEEILASECYGTTYTLDPSSNTCPPNTSVLYYQTSWSYDRSGASGAQGATGDTHRTDPTVRKGERLIDAWEKSRGEGDNGR